MRKTTKPLQFASTFTHNGIDYEVGYRVARHLRIKPIFDEKTQCFRLPQVSVRQLRLALKAYARQHGAD